MANLSEIKKDSNWGEAASTINSNFQNMNVDLEKVKSATTKFRGYFTSETVLKQKYPSPQVGDTAYVGEPYPGTVYDVQVAGTWHNTGTAPDTEAVDLTEYAKKEELTDVSNSVGLYNVDDNVPLGSGFYTSTTARAAVPEDVRKIGLIITYKTDEKTSVTEQFSGSDISAWTDDTNWGSIGSEGGNKILTWNTDVYTTRRQVQLKDRKELLQISYKDGEGNAVNEQYIGTDLDDDSWVDDIYWQKFLVEKKSQAIIEGTDSYEKDYYLLQSGKMIRGFTSNKYYGHSTHDFYKVKKGEIIEVISFSQYDKSIIAFYTEKDESTYVESVNAINADNLSKGEIAFINKSTYVPKSDGYIRVYSFYSKDASHNILHILSLDGTNIISSPILIIGENNGLSYLDDLLYNYKENSNVFESEGYENDIFLEYFYLANKGVGINADSEKNHTSKFIAVKRVIRLLYIRIMIKILIHFYFIHQIKTLSVNILLKEILMLLFQLNIPLIQMDLYKYSTMKLKENGLIMVYIMVKLYHILK